MSCGSTSASISTSETTVKLNASATPIRTRDAPVKPAPATTTGVRPVDGPVPGCTVSTVGAGGRYRNRPPADDADVPAVVVTRTSTPIGVPGGDTASITPPSTTVND